jgi:hypothetical protein
LRSEYFSGLKQEMKSRASININMINSLLVFNKSSRTSVAAILVKLKF